jgi:hypothetical protein
MTINKVIVPGETAFDLLEISTLTLKELEAPIRMRNVSLLRLVAVL